MSLPRISLEQWSALATVAEAGSYAKAAEKLHKSQSSVTYAVQQIESLLGVKAFTIVGRKAVLTPTRELLFRRARHLLDEAAALESTHPSSPALDRALATQQSHQRRSKTATSSSVSLD